MDLVVTIALNQITYISLQFCFKFKRTLKSQMGEIEKQDFWVAPYLLWIYHRYVIGNITDHTEKVYNAPNISILCSDLTFIIRNAFESLLANSDIDEINSQVTDIHVYSRLLQSKQQPYQVYVCLLICVFIFVLYNTWGSTWWVGAVLEKVLSQIFWYSLNQKWKHWRHSSQYN